MRASIVSFIVILISLFLIWFTNDYSIHPRVRRLHQKSFVASGFERVRSKYECAFLFVQNHVDFANDMTNIELLNFWTGNY